MKKQEHKGELNPADKLAGDASMKKTITLDFRDWKDLTFLKLELNHNNLSETIRYLLYEVEDKNAD